MAPKKDKGKKKRGGETVFTEVEKAFYEFQLADCNQKVARLRTAVDDYEVRNEELQKFYDQLDEDRADIIAFLKKNLNIKNEEYAELKEKVIALEELREIETAQFNETVTELESNFSTMKDQLTSENKLLAGKLNTLEEFRAIKDDLMKKYDRQERSFEDQEMKYKRMLYDTEKKFVIGKDKLKREMEGRLLQLAQEFQDASELRIAASTHRVIRENIALNNQLDSLLMTQAQVAEQNENFREDERASRVAKEVAEEDRDKAINKSIVQLKVIDQLTMAYQDAKKQKALHDKRLQDNEKLQAKMQRLTQDNESLLLQVRILEQNLHATLGEQNKSVVETAKLLREREKFKKILKEAAFAVQASLKLDHWSTLDPRREILDREVVLKKILGVINQYRDTARAESMESLVSLSKIYEKGDLGFEVAPAQRKSVVTAGMITSSLESFEDRRSSLSSSVEDSSLISIKTAPSIELVPAEEVSSLSVKESVPSFTVTSLHSSMSEPETEEVSDGIYELKKLLEKSKIDMQKSFMQDFALSQMALLSAQSISQEKKFSQILSKSSLFSQSTIEEKSSGSKVETPGETSGETPEEIPKEMQDASEPVDESAQDEQVEGAEKTEDGEISPPATSEET